MASSKACYKLITITVLLLSFTFTSLAGNAENADVSECKAESGDPLCHNNKEAKKLKIIAIPSILVASMIGVSLPLLTRSIPALGPDRDMFVLVKCLASGVILATGFMHVLPDSYDDLTSKCLPEEPWRKFPFTTFIAMVSALLVLMIDSFAMSAYARRDSKREGEVVPLENGSNSVDTQDEIQTLENGSNYVEKQEKVNDNKTSQLLRNKVIAQILELGIVVHSVVIGLAMGASDNQCTIRSLIAALCFHQLFEGMGLGGSILQAQFKSKTNWMMVFFFSVTTPFGIVLGMAIQKIYDETSPTALIVVGVLNACSTGLLIYMALVNLLAHEFFGPKIQGNMKLHILGYVAVFIGAGAMTLMAKWA
ncbi:Zinc/iron permease fungal/plant [Arabidopsis thaliana x Arabidopsis arenosa]|uniref:Zinc/iron permease fungal/plant n=1 Tax=Arabidopsis thaliana x Arabidopsis arenosa TaxID=1240361 RepID=A0A8T1ZIT2_9BRAS|nr:Zinc/iron permease fungal/plant [Arabidopsis thaliana x Arabidopsis arenosa]